MDTGIRTAVATNENMNRGTRTMNLKGNVVCADRLNEYSVGATFAVTENANKTNRNRENFWPAGTRITCKRPGRPLTSFTFDHRSFASNAAAKAAPRICTSVW